MKIFGKNWKALEDRMNGRSQQHIKNRYFGRLKKLHDKKVHSGGNRHKNSAESAQSHWSTISYNILLFRKLSDHKNHLFASFHKKWSLRRSFHHIFFPPKAFSMESSANLPLLQIYFLIFFYQWKESKSMPTFKIIRSGEVSYPRRGTYCTGGRTTGPF